MVHIIEPCCYDKQLTDLLSQIEGKSNVAHFFSNSDWDLNVLLPYLLLRAPGAEVTLCLVNVEQSVLETVRKLMNRKAVNPVTKEPMMMISHLSLLTRGNNQKEVLDFLKGFGDRLTVSEGRIGFRCLALSNGTRRVVVQGSINQQILTDTQMYTITTGEALYNEAYGYLKAIVKVGVIPDWEQAYERILKQQTY